jgi:hypothetical protein
MIFFPLESSSSYRILLSVPAGGDPCAGSVPGDKGGVMPGEVPVVLGFTLSASGLLRRLKSNPQPCSSK